MLQNNGVIENLSDGQDNNSVFLAHPKRYRITEPQLEILLPMIREYDEQLFSLANFVKCEAIISFFDYVLYLKKRISKIKDSNKILSYPEMAEDAYIVYKKLEFNRTEINVCIEEGVNNLNDLKDMVAERNRISQTQLLLIKEPLARLYASFLVNVAFLNIRSVFIAGESVKNTLSKKTEASNRAVVPVKLIPKLGLEIEAIVDRTACSFEALVRDSKTGNRFEIGSIKTDEVMEKHSIGSGWGGLETNPKLVKEYFNMLAEYGYDRSMYNESVSLLEMQIALDEDEIDNFFDYIEEFELLWNYSISLSNVIKEEMKKGNFIIADFSFTDNYEYIVAKE